MTHRPTSMAAWESILPQGPSIKRKIMGMLDFWAKEGCTVEEICDFLEGRHQTISARLVELERAGLIFDSGRTRPTSSGRQAVIWVSHRLWAKGDLDQVEMFPEEAKT